MVESPRRLARFSVQGLVESFSSLVGRALSRFSGVRRENSPETGVDVVDSEVAVASTEVVYDVGVVLEDDSIFDDHGSNPPSQKRLAVKAAKARNREERKRKARLRQNECIGERKGARNRKVSMLRRVGKEIRGHHD